MAIDDLLRALERDAAAEIDAILAAARADADRKDAEAARDRATRAAAADARATADELAVADAVRIDAEHRARAIALTARATMLARIHAAALAALPEAIAAHAADLGPRLAAAAVACAGDTPGELRCAPPLAAHARAAAPRSLRIVEDPALTGVVIELDGGARIEATLAALLAREWPRLAAEALVAAEAGR